MVLLIYIETLSLMADLAADPSSDLGVVRDDSPLVHTVLALLLLLVATALAVFKPRGMTRYGWRKQYEQRRKRYTMEPDPIYREES
jgi:hypothetical protein